MHVMWTRRALTAGLCMPLRLTVLLAIPVRSTSSGMCVCALPAHTCAQAVSGRSSCWPTPTAWVVSAPCVRRGRRATTCISSWPGASPCSCGSTTELTTAHVLPSDSLTQPAHARAPHLPVCKRTCGCMRHAPSECKASACTRMANMRKHAAGGQCVCMHIQYGPWPL